MGYTIDELPSEAKRNLVGEMIDKKNGASDKDWAEICDEFDLTVNAETLRKAGVGVKLASDAGMSFCGSSDESGTEYMERQKMRDLGNKLNAAYRSESRSQLLRETVQQAVQQLPSFPEIEIQPRPQDKDHRARELVVAMGDFHYGADIDVRGLYGECLNRYNSEIFETRMQKLLDDIIWIIKREEIGFVNLFFMGDLVDGMLRQSQLMKLEYGLVESVIHLSEYLSRWINELSAYATVVVIGVTGNHSEVRPFKSKAREFPDENLEKIIFWFLDERLKDNDNVIVMRDCGQMSKITICGYNFVLLHGDGEKSIDQIARNTVNLYGERVDYFVCGHLHKEQEFPAGYTIDGNSLIIRVPSLCGMDKYAQSKGYGGRAGATAFVMSPKYGRQVVYPIDLGTVS